MSDSDVNLVKETKPVTMTFASETDVEGGQGIDADNKLEGASLHDGDNYSGSIGQAIVGGKNNQNNIHNGDVVTIRIFQLSIEDKAQAQVPSLPVMDEIRWKELYLNIKRNIAEGWVDVDADDAGDDNISSRRLIIYTGMDIARKRLNSLAEIVFTLTPSGSPQGRDSWPTVVWKTLRFQPKTTIRYDISWYSRSGFCSVEEQNDLTLKPGDLAAVLEPKHIAVLQDSDDEGVPTFSPRLQAPIDNSDIAVFNKSLSRRRFALCTIDPTRPETNQFLPVVDVGSLEPDAIHLCGAPVMLQAFVIRGYQERNPIDTRKLTRPLFIDKAGKPKPIDIRDLNSATSFRLYSNFAGKVILEKD